jgi:hypothetical protein
MVGQMRLVGLVFLLGGLPGCGGITRSASAQAGASGADAHAGAGNAVGSAGASGDTHSDAPPSQCAGGDCPATLPSAIAIGDDHACVLGEDGTVKCWGANAYGQLGDGTEVSRETPVRVKDVSNAQSVTSGGHHSCALLKDGTVSCWGMGGTQGSDAPSSGTPLLVPGVDRVTMIAAGGGYTCALREDETVWCWGADLAGGVGDAEAYSPARVEGITDAKTIAAGMLHACASLADGSAKCWGWNGVGTLGDGTTTDRALPVTVVGLDDVTMLALGWWVSCALKKDGTVSCWGDNGSGALGTARGGPGRADSVPPVVAIGLSNVVTLAAGGDHVCAGMNDGTVSCWGNNKYGQVGDGGGVDAVFSPSPVQGLSHVKGLSLSMVRSYALVDDGDTLSAWCWPCNDDWASDSSTVPIKSANGP